MTARIVVADDEADIRRLITFVLKRRGHTVLEANAGDVALELIRQEMPDLVTLDVMMPGLTGLEVAAALASDPVTAGIPVIILSAKGQATEVEAGLQAGVCSYLVKPFESKELAERVEQLLAKRQEAAGS